MARYVDTTTGVELMNLVTTRAQQIAIAITRSPYWGSYPQLSINQLDFMRKHAGSLSPHGVPKSLLTVSIREAINYG